MKLTKHLISTILAICLLAVAPVSVGASNMPLASSDELMVPYDGVSVQSLVQPRAMVSMCSGISKVSSTSVKLLGSAALQLPKTTMYYLDLYRSSSGTPVYYKTIASGSSSSVYFERLETVTVDPGYKYQCVFTIVNTDFPYGVIAQSDILPM